MLAFTIAGAAIWFLEMAWPYILATILIAIVLAAVAAARRPAPVEVLDTGKAKSQLTQHLRMTDQEREQVATALRAAGADGRLDVDELEERVAAAYRAKQWSDVKGLLADL